MVVEICACPRIAMITRGCSPCAIRKVAQEWRKSWNRIAIALALVNTTLAMSPSLCQGLPPSSSFAVHAFLCSRVISWFIPSWYCRRMLGSPPSGDKKGGDVAAGATPARERDSAFPRANKTLLVLPLLIWFQQIDQWRSTRPILERLSQMRRLDRCLFCQLGDALCDGEHARDLLIRQLELPNRRCQQALACSIQCVGRTWPAACLGCTGDHLLIWLAAPPAPVGHALLGVGVGGFDHQFSCQRSPKRGPSLPCDDRLGCAATHKVRIASVPANARRCNVSRYAVGAADAPKCECI